VTTTDIEPYRFVTVEEVWRLIPGLGYSTIRSKIRRGELPAFHAGRGRKLFVRLGDVQKLMIPVVQSKTESGE